MSNINFKIDNGVGIITLNRPDKFNSFVRQMAFDLQAALDECEKNPEVRAVYITAEGKAFCAGQDLAGSHRSQANRITQNCRRTLQSDYRTIEKN